MHVDLPTIHKKLPSTFLLLFLDYHDHRPISAFFQSSEPQGSLEAGGGLGIASESDGRHSEDVRA